MIQQMKKEHGSQIQVCFHVSAITQDYTRSIFILMFIRPVITTTHLASHVGVSFTYTNGLTNLLT